MEVFESRNKRVPVCSVNFTVGDSETVSFWPAGLISVGRPEEDQCVLLGLGGCVPLHQHQPALVTWRAQRLRLLCLPGEITGSWSEGQPLHRQHGRTDLWKTRWWEMSERTWFYLSHSCSDAVSVHCSGRPQSHSTRPCKTPCALRTSCANCTSQAMECMWCGSAQRCVDSSAYVISFPYGQCLEWQTQDCTGEDFYFSVLSHRKMLILELLNMFYTK